MASVEVLITGDESKIGTAILRASAKGAQVAGMRVSETMGYQGGAEWLCLFGVGDRVRGEARERQLAAGGHALLWDLGYLGASKDPAIAYARMAIDDFHPQRWLGRTPSDGSRWAEHGIDLRRDCDPAGPVVVIGMGPKSRDHLSLFEWEMNTLKSARERFPERRIVYRPKRDIYPLAWEPQNNSQRIEDVLRGASLVICHHSNVGIDACIAGVPVETEDGAAAWLYADGSDPVAERRLDFLHRVAWWNWKLSEMGEAWSFARGMIEN